MDLVIWRFAELIFDSDFTVYLKTESSSEQRKELKSWKLYMLIDFAMFEPLSRLALGAPNFTIG